VSNLSKYIQRISSAQKMADITKAAAEAKESRPLPLLTLLHTAPNINNDRAMNPNDTFSV
jgi:hypothetical protein